MEPSNVQILETGISIDESYLIAPITNNTYLIVRVASFDVIGLRQR